MLEDGMRRRLVGTRVTRWIYALLAAAGCGGESDVPAGATASGDTVVAVQLSLIGELDGPEEYLFGDVTSVAIGPTDIVYVADRIGATIRAYDVSGRFLGTVGSEGDGPGEFQRPNDLAFDPEGRLFVRDAHRITVLSRRESSGLADSVVRTSSLTGYANLSSTRARTDGDLYYYPGYLFWDGEPDRYFYQVFDAAGATGDTVRVPPLPNLEFLGSASFRTSARGGRLLRGVNRAPFEPTASWDIKPDGSLITSPGDRYEIVELSPVGDTVRFVEVELPPRPVPQSEARDSARAFRARLDSLPVPLARVVGMSEAARTATLPEVLPEVLAVHVAPDESIWLQRWPPPGSGDQTLFDVIGREGAVLHTVVVPTLILQDPPPFVSAEFVVGVVRDPETEVDRVAVFRVANE
jgi:hypothetical protein